MYDHEALKDEELLLLSRLGDREAETALMVRYFRRRYRHAKRAADNLYLRFTPEDFVAVYLATFTQAVNSYRFGLALPSERHDSRSQETGDYQRLDCSGYLI